MSAFFGDPRLLPLAGLGLLSLVKSQTGSSARIAPPSRKNQIDWSKGATEVFKRKFTRSVRSVAFSPDGRHLAVGGRDKHARVFEVNP